VRLGTHRFPGRKVNERKGYFPRKTERKDEILGRAMLKLRKKKTRQRGRSCVKGRCSNLASRGGGGGSLGRAWEAERRLGVLRLSGQDRAKPGGTQESGRKKIARL